MKPPRYPMLYACAGLLLGLLLALGSLPWDAVAAPSGTPPGAAAKGDPTHKARAPLPEVGETPDFRYQREQGNMYRVLPTDGSSSYLVSASFLQTTLGNSQVDSHQQAALLRTYPALMQEMFTQTLTTAYPDATVEHESPFAPLSLTGPDGTQAQVTQDPAAAPYVRVQFRSHDGHLQEYSVSRNIVEQLLANERLTDAQRLQGLQAFPFRLPETARGGDFARLSMSELAALVQQEPTLQRHDFIRMAPPYTGDAETSAARLPRRQHATLPPPTVPASLSAGGLRAPQPAPAAPPAPPLAVEETGPSSQTSPTAEAERLGVPSQPAPVAQATVGVASVPDGVSGSASRWGWYLVTFVLFAAGLAALVLAYGHRE